MPKAFPLHLLGFPALPKKNRSRLGIVPRFTLACTDDDGRERTSEVKWGKTGRTSDISVNGRFNADGDGDGDKAEGGKGFLKLPDRHAAAGINRVGLSGRTHSGIHFPLKIP